MTFYFHRLTKQIAPLIKKSMPNTTNNSLTSPQEKQEDLLLILSILKLLLIILLRIGVLLIQLGCIPIKNIYYILIQNIVDFCITLKCFSLCGITLYCGQSRIYGFVGFGVTLNDDWLNINDVITGYSSVLLASSIVTIFNSGRLHMFSTIVSAGILSGVVIPIIMHMTWQKTGWTQDKIVLGHVVNYVDHSGATIHVTSAIVGLIGAIFLGRRLIKLKDIDESSIGADSPSAILLGYFFVFIGLIGYSFPRQFIENEQLTKATVLIIINNLMAISSSILITILLQLLCTKQQFNYWNIISCVQGGVCGLVMVSSGVDNYNPFVCFAIGLIAGLVFFLTSKIIFATSIEDYCHVLAVHFFGGFIGNFLPPLLGNSEMMGYKTTWPTLGANMLWQLGCIVFFVILISPIFILVFFVLWGTGFLRNRDDAVCHNRTLQLEHGLQINCLRRLFSLYNDSVFIEPGISGRTTQSVLDTTDCKKPFNVGSKSTNSSNQDFDKNDKTSKSNDSENYLQQNSVQKFINQSPKLLKKNEECNAKPPKIEELFRTSLNSNEFKKKLNFADIFIKPNAGGDNSISENLEHNLVQSLERKKLQRERLHLGINMHRANKEANLYKLKRNNMFRNNKTLNGKLSSSSHHFLTLTKSSVMKDKVYNDGFITIKMPPQKRSIFGF